MVTALYSVLMANIFSLNRNLANATFILTHAICLAAIALASVVSKATGSPSLSWYTQAETNTPAERLLILRTR